MPQLLEATFSISMDEPAMMLRETNRMRPDRHGRDRYQVIWVVRDDKVVEWQSSMGPEDEFVQAQFTLIGGEKLPDGNIKIWETVGRLRDMADHIHEFGFESDRQVEYEPVNLAQLFSDTMDRVQRARVDHKVFAQ